jgi:predicted SprT family Zn-dependent metalloprotease
VKISDAQIIAEKLMAQHGLDDWTFQFDNAKRRFGATWLTLKRITLSKPLTELNDETHVVNTILHEIAHAIAGPGHNHDNHWRSVAQKIGCDGNRTYSNEVVKPKMNRTLYVGTCPACERRIRRYKRNNMSCGRCSESYDERFKFVWHKI